MTYDLDGFLKLSTAEQELRMCEWLADIATTPDEQEQQERIRSLILSIFPLKAEDRRKAIQVRTEVMLQLPGNQAKAIIRARYQAMQDCQTENDMDRRIVMEIIQQMPPDAQKQVAQLVAEIRDEVADST